MAVTGIQIPPPKLRITYMVRRLLTGLFYFTKLSDGTFFDPAKYPSDRSRSLFFFG